MSLIICILRLRVSPLSFDCGVLNSAYLLCYAFGISFKLHRWLENLNLWINYFNVSTIKILKKFVHLLILILKLCLSLCFPRPNTASYLIHSYKYTILLKYPVILSYTSNCLPYHNSIVHFSVRLFHTNSTSLGCQLDIITIGAI